MPTVLVTGASGFIGSALVTELSDRGMSVRAMTRRPEDYSGPAEAVGGDVGDYQSLVKALDGVDIAVYLVHGLGDEEFEVRDAAAATRFAGATAACGVGQTVYLGGLGKGRLSRHLASRREVEELLGLQGTPVTTLRASVVIGRGGISWDMTRQIAERLPALVVPTWAHVQTQPIALADAVRYLADVIDHPDALGKTFDIGGPDRLSFLEMLQGAARVLMGSEMPVLTVPISPQLAVSKIAGLLTDVDTLTAEQLIESMSCESVVTEDSIRSISPDEPMTYEQAIKAALA